MSFHTDLVIASFKHKGLKRLAEQGDRSKIRPDLADKIERILSVLDAAATTQALDLPGYRLHALKGDSEGILVRHRAGQLAHHFSL